MRFAGFVLAGGESRRMGRDKGLLPYLGEPLAGFLARTVSQVTDSVHIIADPSRYGHLGYPVVPDAVAPCGPAGGIYTALLQNRAEWNLVVACDMPQIDPNVLWALVQHAAMGGGDCIVPLGPDGQPEPLCAIYHSRCLPALKQAISDKRLRMKDLVAEMHPILVAGTAAACFANVNTPADLRQLEDQAT
jgi:molybdopterin-guanine dinucleotide biosynthesis protein A